MTLPHHLKQLLDAELEAGDIMENARQATLSMRRQIEQLARAEVEPYKDQMIREQRLDTEKKPQVVVPEKPEAIVSKDHTHKAALLMYNRVLDVEPTLERHAVANLVHADDRMTRRDKDLAIKTLFDRQQPTVIVNNKEARPGVEPLHNDSRHTNRTQAAAPPPPPVMAPPCPPPVKEQLPLEHVVVVPTTNNSTHQTDYDDPSPCTNNQENNQEKQPPCMQSEVINDHPSSPADADDDPSPPVGEEDSCLKKEEEYRETSFTKQQQQRTPPTSFSEPVGGDKSVRSSHRKSSLLSRCFGRCGRKLSNKTNNRRRRG